MMSDDDLDALLKDTRVIRHAQKLLSVRDNAIFFSDLAAEHGSAAKFFADWPVSDFTGLLQLMKKRGSRIGGNTGAYALRFMGKDSFIMGGDVVKALRIFHQKSPLESPRTKPAPGIGNRTGAPPAPICPFRSKRSGTPSGASVSSPVSVMASVRRVVPRVRNLASSATC